MQFNELRTAQIKAGKQRNYLQGAHSYDVLANPLYMDDFQYVAVNVPDREKQIIDDDSDEDNDALQSDLVRVVLNLAYMDEDRVNDFDLKKVNY